VGTYRLGIVLLSDNSLSEQKLLVVDLTSDYHHDYDCLSYNTTFGIIVLKYLLLCFSGPRSAYKSSAIKLRAESIKSLLQIVKKHLTSHSLIIIHIFRSTKCTPF